MCVCVCVCARILINIFINLSIQLKYCAGIEKKQVTNLVPSGPRVVGNRLGNHRSTVQ